MISSEHAHQPAFTLELPENNLKTQEKNRSFLPALIKSLGLTLLFLFIFIVITTIGTGLYLRNKVLTFARAANTSIPQLEQIAKQGWHTTPQQRDGKVTFLILGTDEVENRGASTHLTDTMLLATLNLKTGQVSLLPLPRDVWSDEYETRINALYVYGHDRYPSEPEKFPREVLEQMFGVKIDHTVVLNLPTLAQLIDTAGGVEVNIPEGFIDSEFPRSDVDITKERDPKKLYETIEFKTGTEIMNGERVLKYIRSRHSTGDQGDDVARSQRQQQVILSLVNTLKNPHFYFDTERAGELYAFYQTHFDKALPITELIGIGKSLYPVRNSIKFSTNAISIFPDNPQGVITHPPVKETKGQWVYTVRDSQKLATEVKQKLGIAP
jgi:LCP family protein required for cell wall assembly